MLKVHLRVKQFVFVCSNVLWNQWNKLIIHEWFGEQTILLQIKQESLLALIFRYSEKQYMVIYGQMPTTTRFCSRCYSNLKQRLLRRYMYISYYMPFPINRRLDINHTGILCSLLAYRQLITWFQAYTINWLIRVFVLIFIDSSHLKFGTTDITS